MNPQRGKEFVKLTEKLGWDSPTYLSKKWELDRKTVYNWRKNGPPVYVLEYLRQSLRLKENYDRVMGL